MAKSGSKEKKEKLTPAKRKDAIKMYDSVKNYSKVAKIFGVNYQAIQHLVKHREKFLIKSDDSLKGHSCVRHPFFETKLVHILMFCRANKMPLNGYFII